MIALSLPEMRACASEKKESGAEFDYIDRWLKSNDLSQVNEGMDSLFPGMEIDSGQMLVMIMEGNAPQAFKMFAHILNNEICRFILKRTLAI